MEITSKELNEIYKTRLLERRDKFLQCLEHVDKVAERLKYQEVLTENEMIGIISKPIRQHQKEAMLYHLTHKNFDLIDRIIYAMDVQLNGAVCVLLKTMKILIYKQLKFDPRILKKPLTGIGLDAPRETLVPVGEDSDSGANERAKLRSGDDYVNQDSSSDDSEPPDPPKPKTNLSTDGPRNGLADQSDIPLVPVGPGRGARRHAPQPPQNNGDSSFTSTSSEDSGIDSSRIRIQELIQNGEYSDLQKEIESVHKLEELVDLDPSTKQTSLHACVLRANDVMECVKTLLEKFKELESKEMSKSAFIPASNKKEEDKRWTLSRFVDWEDGKKQTAVHLAAESSLVAIIKELYGTYQCDIFIKDQLGRSALEIMYMHAPEAVESILDLAIPTKKNHPSDGNFSMEIDFRPVIGISPTKYSQVAAGTPVPDPCYEETALLAELINQSDVSSKIILQHIIVKLFLEFKWAKMQSWFYFSIISQILLHLWYTLFIIQVFLVKCRYKTKGRNHSSSFPEGSGPDAKDGDTDEDLPAPRTIWHYIFGEWEPVEQIFTLYPLKGSYQQECPLDTFWRSQALILFGLGVLFLLKEVFELYLKVRMVSEHRKIGKWRKLFAGLFAYLTTLENVFQVICAVLMVLVTTLAFGNTLTDFHYSAASVSVIVAWGLILMQLGNVSGLGIYVQILGKVIKRFSTLMGVYIVIIISFSIAFSIMFPNEKPFQTLPKAISRVLIMMTGEFNYDETFYNDSEAGPPIPLTGHFIFGCFAILLTIILMNLLIGMVVSDVRSLKGKSEVVLLSLKIDQLSVMENSLIHMRRILIPLQKLFKYCSRNSSKISKDGDFLDIFVIPPSRSATCMVIWKSIKDIPVHLRQPLRDFATRGPTQTSSGVRLSSMEDD